MKRIFTVLALAAVTFATSVFSSAAHAGNSPYLVDFMTLSSKHADLRLAIAGKGMEAAFNEWLRTAHPEAARQGRVVISGVQTTPNCQTGKKCIQDPSCSTKVPCHSASCKFCSA
jgi:hypothetical protein